MQKVKYKNIMLEMIKNDETKIEIAEILEITTQSLLSKLRGKTDWKIREIEILCNHWNKDYYELFKKENLK